MRGVFCSRPALDVVSRIHKSVVAHVREAPLRARDVNRPDEFTIAGAVTEAADALVLGFTGGVAGAAVPTPRGGVRARDDDDRIFLRATSEGAEGAWSDLSESLGAASPYGPSPRQQGVIGTVLGTETLRRIQSDERERWRAVPRGAQLDARDWPGLAGALRGGRFTVRATAFYQPLAPVAVPDPFPEPGDEPSLAAFEFVDDRPRGVVYPDDVRVDP